MELTDCGMFLSDKSGVFNDFFRRIDKYYMLIRRFTNATFRLFIREKWNKDACQEYNRILSNKGGPLW
jgi:Nucleolar protein,Nop52